MVCVCERERDLFQIRSRVNVARTDTDVCEYYTFMHARTHMSAAMWCPLSSTDIYIKKYLKPIRPACLFMACDIHIFQ